VDGCNHRNVRVEQRVGRRCEPRYDLDRVCRLATSHDLTHVVPGTEGGIRTGDHETTARGRADGALELVVGLEPQRVAHIWTVQGDELHLALPCHVDVFVHHVAPPLGPRVQPLTSSNFRAWLTPSISSETSAPCGARATSTPSSTTSPTTPSITTSP